MDTYDNHIAKIVLWNLGCVPRSCLNATVIISTLTYCVIAAVDTYDNHKAEIVMWNGRLVSSLSVVTVNRFMHSVIIQVIVVTTVISNFLKTRLLH